MYRPPHGKYNYQSGIKNLEICSLMKQLDSPIPTPLGWIANYIRNITGDLIHACPYRSGHYELKNVTTSISMYQGMNRGDYKFSMFFRDDVDREGMNLTFYFTIIIRGGEAF
jgi:hypothetical protein